MLLVKLDCHAAKQQNMCNLYAFETTNKAFPQLHCLDDVGCVPVKSLFLLKYDETPCSLGPLFPIVHNLNGAMNQG